MGTMTEEDPRAVLRRHGLRPRRSLSQNFLRDRNAAARIVRETVQVDAPVVELGPGVGTLSVGLLDAGARLIAIEKDRAMIAVLQEELGHRDNFTVRQGDATEVDYKALAAEVGDRISVVGNLPYAVTGAILRRIVEDRAAIAQAVVMVQHEVYQRLTAQPGTKTYGALSVFVQAQFALSRVITLNPGAFFPAPKVKSTVVTLRPHDVAIAEETPAFTAVVRASFAQRRKTLRNALGAIGSAQRVQAALETADLDPGARGETLSVAQFAELGQAWASFDPDVD